MDPRSRYNGKMYISVMTGPVAFAFGKITEVPIFYNPLDHSYRERIGIAMYTYIIKRHKTMPLPIAVARLHKSNKAYARCQITLPQLQLRSLKGWYKDMV